MVNAMGAKKAVHSLDVDGRFDSVLDLSGKGEQGSIALIGRMAPGTDGADTESLWISLAGTLSIRLAAVLEVTNADPQKFPDLDYICGVPFIESSIAFNKGYLCQATVRHWCAVSVALLS